MNRHKRVDFDASSDFAIWKECKEWNLFQSHTHDALLQPEIWGSVNVLIFLQKVRKPPFFAALKTFDRFRGKIKYVIHCDNNTDVFCAVHYVNNMLMKKVSPDFSLTSRFSQPSTSGERQTFVSHFYGLVGRGGFLFFTRSFLAEQCHCKSEARNPC